MSLAHQSLLTPSTNLLPFIFGVSGLEAIPGTVLSRLLRDLGLSEAAARTTIARTRRRGGITSERSGRRTVYRLAGPSKQFVERTRAGVPPVSWMGRFHSVVYRVPGSGRAFGDQLRWQSSRVGYAALRSGVLICPEDRWSMVTDLLGPTPKAAQVLAGHLELDLAQARVAADLAWQLRDLAARYRREIARFDRAADHRPPDTADATTLRRFLRIQHPSIALLGRDPNLPTELLPPDWPRAEMWGARIDFYREWGSAVLRYVDHVVEQTGTGDLVLPLPVRRWVDTTGFAQLTGAKWVAPDAPAHGG